MIDNSFLNALYYKRLGMGKNNRVKNIPKAKTILYPIAYERKYFTIIKNIMVKFKDLTNSIIQAKLEFWLKESKIHDSIKLDDWSDDINSNLNDLQDLDTELFEQKKKELEIELTTLAIFIFNFQNKQFNKVVNQITGLDVFTPTPWWNDMMKSWINDNISLIRGLDQEYIKNINTIVSNGIRVGNTWDDISRDLKILGDKITGYRSKLIARDQIGKLYGQLNKRRQNDIGISTYYWQTVGDEIVRSTHRSLNGLSCRWDDNTVYSDDNGKTWKQRTSNMFIGIPGQDYQCRCNAAPNFLNIIREIDNSIDRSKQ